MRRTERASADLILLTALLLLSAMLSRSSQQYHLSTQLMQNQVHTWRAGRIARNQAIEGAPEPGHRATSGIQCLSGNARIGSVTRLTYRCDYIPASAPTPLHAFSYDRLFDRHEPCPTRTGRHSEIPEWTQRSRFECKLKDPPTESIILNGDTFLTGELRIPAATENLIASRGSFRAPLLDVKSNLTIVALGDISISTIRNSSDTPVHLMLIAPLGTVSLEHTQGRAGITITARRDRSAAGITHLPPRPSRFIFQLPSLPLGLFNQTSELVP